MPPEHQQQIFKVKQFYWENHRMPSYGELADILNFKSKYSAQYLVKKWLKVGIVNRDYKGKITPGKLFMPLKLLGTIQAGLPTPAEEQDLDSISLDDWLINKKSDNFMLKVTGDSMIEAGIQPDDQVIVERGRAPKNGDIVVAEVDNEWTLKYFEKRNNQTRLIPANKNYKPIIPRQELKIGGIVTAVVRKY
ncbi:transcriptional repressor LexA [Patescibacteria group bacterium]|nr:transcriptional repressor LexA [Patescibacteria group bacterium]